MEDPKPSAMKNIEELDIFLFRNGQSLSPPRKFHLTTEELSRWKATLVHLGRMEYDTTYPSIQLYTLDGKVMNGPEELEDGATYVAVPYPDPFIPSGYDHYLNKASKAREKRLSKSKTVEVDNTAISKDNQTDDRSINIPVDNVVVVNRLPDIKMQNPIIQSEKPNNLQQPRWNPCGQRLCGLQPLANPPRQRFPGVGRTLGSGPIGLSGHKAVLNKRQPNSRQGGRLTQPSCTGRCSSFGDKNSDVKTAPDINFSKNLNNQNSKMPISNTYHVKRLENSMNKLKLPSIKLNNREIDDLNKIKNTIKNQETLSNRTSRPSDNNTYSEVIKTTTVEIENKSKNEFLQKLDAVQSGKKVAPIRTTDYLKTVKPYNLMKEIENLTIFSTNCMESTNANEKTEHSNKIVPNIPTDLEKIVRIFEQTDPNNSIKEELQSRKSEAEISNEHKMTEQTTSLKQSPKENVKGVTLNKNNKIQDKRTIKTTRFSKEIEKISSTLGQSPSNKKANPILISLVSKLTGLAETDNANASQDPAATPTHNNIQKLTDLDKNLVVMQAINNTARNCDNMSTLENPDIKIKSEQLETETKKSITTQKNNEVVRKSEESLGVSFTNEPNIRIYSKDITNNSHSTVEQGPPIEYVPGIINLKHKESSKIQNQTDISDQSSVVSSNLNANGKSNKSYENIFLSEPETEKANRIDSKDNKLLNNKIPHDSSHQDVAVLPVLEKLSNNPKHAKNIDLGLRAEVGNNVGTLNPNRDSQRDENITSVEQSDHNLIPKDFSITNRDIDLTRGDSNSKNKDVLTAMGTTTTLLTLYKSPTENLKSTQTSESLTNTNKYIHEGPELDTKLIYVNGINSKLDKENNYDKMHDIHSFDSLDSNGTTFRKDINNPTSDKLKIPTPVPKMSLGTFQKGSQCQNCHKKLMVFVHNSDQVNLQVNIEVRSASGTLKSKQAVNTNKSNSKTSTEKDESNDDAKLMQSKSLQSAGNIVLPHICCQKNLNVVVNKCPCCDRIAPDTACNERVTNLPFHCGLQPYYLMMPVMPPSSLTECRRKPEQCDKQIQICESLLNCGCYPETCGNLRKQEAKRVSIVTQTSSCLLCKKSNQDSSTQTEWCNLLLEPRLQEDGHYTFFLPPLNGLPQYSICD